MNLHGFICVLSLSVYKMITCSNILISTQVRMHDFAFMHLQDMLILKDIQIYNICFRFKYKRYQVRTNHVYHFILKITLFPRINIYILHFKY